ncbi:MAG: DUF6519 domain-containing protein [Gammaproteobacteria bacterium]|nr:DUF6519 domain-containing protein [Gammaproteobacteria bacterium]MCF6230881.1 DUF6519 domain-containing protein [Gammaproteobacteria bacterium]
MKGDFSRITYDQRKQYSLLLMQQGRVQLDADWNEQAITQWLNLQNLAEDLIGEHGGPGESFKIEPETDDVSGSTVTHDFTIKRGRYYVRGALCQNSDDCLFTQQEDYFPDDSEKIAHGKAYLVYLHLWWRHMTADEDDDIREVALAGPDTATRLKTVWQVRLLELPAKEAEATSGSAQDLKQDYESFITLLKGKEIIKQGDGLLQAQAKKASEAGKPCITAPENRYRGVENQLYRVEIHHSGEGSGGATFKWSRENGSVIFPVRALSGDTVTLAHLGRDQHFGLKVGDWIEVIDDIYELQRKAENLLKVVEVDSDTLEVTLSGTPSMGRALSVYPLKKPLLRRWDHSAKCAHGTIPIVQDEWIELEDGVEVKFPKPPLMKGEETEPASYWYQSGDWWWIAARTATGDVEWPQGVDGPAAQKALSHGDRYAPLALINSGASGNITVPQDYRRVINPQWQ